MYSRTGITVYGRGAAISRAWRPTKIVAKSTSVTTSVHRRTSSSSSSSSALDAVFPRHENFARRHIGPNDQEQTAMLQYLGLKVSSVQTSAVVVDVNKLALFFFPSPFSPLLVVPLAYGMERGGYAGGYTYSCEVVDQDKNWFGLVCWNCGVPACTCYEYSASSKT